MKFNLNLFDKHPSLKYILPVLVLLLVAGSSFLVLNARKQNTLKVVKKIDSQNTDYIVKENKKLPKTEKKAAKIPKNCSTKPYVKSYKGTSINNKPSVEEYIVPIDCLESFVFTRQGNEEDSNEWSGIFNVYFQKNGSKKYLFKHLGPLMDVAGGTLWNISEQGDAIHLSLGSADLGGKTSWDYYVSRNNEKLLVGFTDNLDILLENDQKYELRLDTEPISCQEESDIRITKSIIYNGKQYKLKNKFQDSCKDVTFSPPPRITVSSVDIDGKKVTLNVPQNKDIVFNYDKGEFIE